MFQMVTGESCQCIQRTKQTEPCHVGVRHAACTVPKCGFVIRYQNTSNLEQHYIRGGLDHKELAGRLAATQQLDRGVQLGAAADGSMALGRTCNAPAFTAEKKARCDMKFVKWLVRKNRALTMAREDDELNEFIDEVNDGDVKQMQAWGDTRIKKIRSDLEACETDAGMGRHENKENSASSCCRGDQDFHRCRHMVFVCTELSLAVYSSSILLSTH